MNEIRKIQNLTKDFGQGRGVFDVSLSIKEGDLFGLVGINGSGKSTITARMKMMKKTDKCNELKRVLQ